MILSLASLVISACDEVHCLDGDRPQFDVNVLPNPVLNQVYEQRIRASVRHRTDDDEFRYSFVLDGDLPQGLTGSSDDRLYTIGGTATELGSYPLQLTVILGNEGFEIDEADVSSLCKKTHTASYTLTVDEL